MDWLKIIAKANRSLPQTQLMLDLCDNDLVTLVKLEEKLNKLQLNLCPADKEAVQYYLNL